jgi:chromosome segregation ATPase
MDNENLQNPEVNEPTPAPETFEQEPESQEPEAPAAEEPVVEEPATEPEQEPAAEEEPAAEPEAEEPAEEPEDEQGLIPEEPLADDPALHFEAQIAELQNQLTEMTTNYENAQTRIQELEAQITSASETEAGLREQIATYEAERTRLEVEKKNSLIEQYATDLTEEEISPIRENVENFSYEELEGKLAVCYAKKHMAGSADNKVVPLPDPAVDEFAIFMSKYRKN